MNILKRLLGRDPELREARFAGKLYPASKGELLEVMERAFSGAPDGEVKPAKVIVVPHSDPSFCGRVVAAGLAHLGTPERIVLLGPSRRVPFRGVAATAYEGWDSPLGWQRVDREAYLPIVELPTARQLPAAHAAEPALELLIPYLKVCAPDVPIVPLLVGDLALGELVTIVDRMAQPDSVLVVASELSEGFPSDQAASYDAETARLLVAGEVDALDDRQMSGRRIVQACLEIADERGWNPREIVRSNSADEGGPSDATIGYGAFVMS